jgi:hypothetical protein
MSQSRTLYLGIDVPNKSIAPAYMDLQALAPVNLLLAGSHKKHWTA